MRQNKRFAADIPENALMLCWERLEILSGEEVPGVEVARFQNFTAHLIAVLLTPGF